ncbi:nitrite reductase/ring-hydroxylating ferredoxin subunit [Pseudarthrobacter sp. W1I19]|uniref:Rieske (2Fe-2S) protein n=1 Tax=Pseudarthrobacter sp. W1I19 TaxID=3042288 RepID=UPI0027855FD3|nr:Rieske 2Fe-2S domain-containing protein [Pseudarthrobacter sp. W1I19]MDQ0922163.1 nitrite reductase/ring-hydroxylating ferredoxin subunit [Pseudarthrobacter sp. W1I19]
MSAGAMADGKAYVLGPVEQIPPGEGRAFAVDGGQVAVFRLRDGSLRALPAVCPHKGGPLADGTIDLNVVVCPLHQHAFDLATGCSLTGADNLRPYVVSTDGQQNLVLQMPV